MINISITTSNNCIWEMICIVGVTQVKYCYRININSVQIQFTQYAFHSNQLQAENALKMTYKSHKSHPGGIFDHSFHSFISSASKLLECVAKALLSRYPQITKSRGFKSDDEGGHSSLEIKLGTLADSHSCVSLAPCDSAESC